MAPVFTVSPGGKGFAVQVQVYGGVPPEGVPPVAESGKLLYGTPTVPAGNNRVLADGVVMISGAVAVLVLSVILSNVM
jgi:hypothetical protein